jgi:hypothetical protein
MRYSDVTTTQVAIAHLLLVPIHCLFAERMVRWEQREE